jgi:hypothetical protein
MYFLAKFGIFLHHSFCVCFVYVWMNVCGGDSTRTGDTAQSINYFYFIMWTFNILSEKVKLGVRNIK